MCTWLQAFFEAQEDNRLCWGQNDFCKQRHTLRHNDAFCGSVWCGGAQRCLQSVADDCGTSSNHRSSRRPHIVQKNPKPAAPCLFKTPATPAVNRTLDMAFIQNLWHPFGVNRMAASLSSPSWYNSADSVKNPSEAVIGCNAAEEIIQMSRRGTERGTLCQTCVKSTKTLFCCHNNLSAIWVGLSR